MEVHAVKFAFKFNAVLGKVAAAADCQLNVSVQKIT